MGNCLSLQLKSLSFSSLSFFPARKRMRKITSQKKYNPSELRSQPSMAKLVHHHPPHRSEEPKGTLQKALAEAHAKERSPPQTPTLAPHDVAKWGGSSLALAWANKRTNVFVFHWTTDLRSHPQAQPDGLWRCDLSTQGRCAPFRRRASARTAPSV